MHDKYKLLLVLALVLAIAAVFYLSNTTVIRKTLYESEQAHYQPYLGENFTNYSGNFRVINSTNENLTKWQNYGIITAFANIRNWSKISRIDLVLTNSKGENVTLYGINNSKIPREDWSTGLFPNYYLNCTGQDREWKAFMVVNGTNFLFWQYNSTLGLNMSNISSVKAYNNDTNIPIHDVVVQHNICRYNNDLGGNWYSPIGLPQYGVFWTNSSGLVLKNVRQSQYPSNGDHVRVLSKNVTPENFTMRIVFKVQNVSSNESQLNNTYIRFGWDFENMYDPGHNETVIFDSFQYNYLGVQRVFPIVRYYAQGSEPNSTDPTFNSSRVRFTFKKGHTYEVDAQVENTSVKVEIWDVGGLWSTKVASLNYKFARARPYGRYPFSIETTGNVGITVKSFYVLKGKSD